MITQWDIISSINRKTGAITYSLLIDGKNVGNLDVKCINCNTYYSYDQLNQDRAEKQMELKPCPFCGADAHMWHWNYGVAIECKEYDPGTHQVCIKARRVDDAIEAWNRRANDG